MAKYSYHTRMGHEPRGGALGCLNKKKQQSRELVNLVLIRSISLFTPPYSPHTHNHIICFRFSPSIALIMADDDTTSFDQIELHKENIQPLASGRSARALVASLSSRSNPVFARAEHTAKQAEFEEELRGSLDLDDPLEVWVRYVSWTQETFPSGHSTDSGLLQLLERATQTFIHEQHYKNDPRYLRLWILYIQNFSDAPREAFAYLARHDIGQRLALFYEEYAAWLEKMGRMRQASEIYQTGMENNARPTDRLLRKFEEYMQRLEYDPPAADEPSSPALPAVRPALAAKPFGGAFGSGGLVSSPATQQQPQASQPKPKQAKQKMAIFSDADAAPTSKAPNTTEKPTSGWENIGTLEQRRKENAIEARPWVGEVLKQEGVKAKSAEKMMIFRDESVSSPTEPRVIIFRLISFLSHIYKSRTNTACLSVLYDQLPVFTEAKCTSCTAKCFTY